MAKIALFIPSRIYGGAERQMALLACLAADDGHEVTLIDSKVGIVLQMLEARSDIKKVIGDGCNRIEVRDSILITQASYAFCLDSMLNIINCDVRFWFMHSLNLPHMYINSKLPSYISKMFSYSFNWFYKKQLQRCSTSFFFMALDLKNAVESHYGIKFEEDFTGLLSEQKFSNDPIVIDSSQHNSLCWLGRLDKSSKLLVVKKLLLDFSNSRLKHRVTQFDIIGDGEAKEELIQYSNSLGLSECVSFHGHVDFNELSAVIRRSFLLFAHGTSVYEGVYANVPVSLVDFYLRSEHLNSMKYEFYADSEGIGLGDLIASGDDLRIIKGDTFDELLLSATSNRAVIVNKQTDKLNRSISIGEERCRALFKEGSNKKIRPKTFLLDVLFFKIRKVILMVRNNSV